MRGSFIEGLWSIDWILADTNVVSMGLLTFQRLRVFGDYYENGRVLGGDAQYYISGTYLIENFGLSMQYTITHYAGDKLPLFANEKKIDISSSGHIDTSIDRDVIELPTQSGKTKDGLKLRLTRRVKVT